MIFKKGYEPLLYFKTRYLNIEIQRSTIELKNNKGSNIHKARRSNVLKCLKCTN